MTTRITARDLEGAQRRYVDTCRRLGLIPDGMHLAFSTGSKTNGNAYRVALTGNRSADGTYPKGSGHGRPPIGDDYLGMTKAEAYDRLHERCRAVEDVEYYREHPERLER